jgi:hypothetical protein
LVVFVAVLAVVRFKPWRSFTTPKAENTQARADLQVGFLPVT